MKRILAMLLSVLCIISCIVSLTGCSGSQDKNLVPLAENTVNTMDIVNTDKTYSRDISDTLILYFSYSGNTEQIANWIQEYTGAEMIRLEAAEPYPRDYDECVERAEAEHNNQDRPALATELSMLADYDTIILGWPCWNYSCPMLIRTMLETYDFSGKTIIRFTTSDVSGFSGSLKEMQESSPKAIFVENGLEVRAKDVAGAQATVNEWLAALGFEKAY